MALPAAFTVAQAIDEAFERIQFDPRALTGEHLVSARRSIRLLLDSWNNDSVDFWKVNAGIQHTVALNEASFVPVTGCIDVLDVALLRDVYTTPMMAISRSDWFAIPDKTTVRGMPSRYWVERITSGPVLHFYPFAENATDIVVYDAMMQFNDSSQLNGAADIPFRWNNAFVCGLTAFLSEKFKPELFDKKMMVYGGPGVPNGAYAVARMGDRERGDTVLVRHQGRRWRR